MVSFEEKRKKIEDIVRKLCQKIQPLEFQLQLHELLMEDTNGGKLYKYRSFDKEGYSLKNLQEGTLHCSRTDAFNDPFDCKIGVTFSSLYTAQYENELTVLSEIFGKYIKIIQGKSRIDEFNVNEQRVINNLLDSKILNEFIYNDYKIETQEEVAMLLNNNAFVILELMKIVLSDKMFKGTLGICAYMLPRLMENISPEGMILLSDENSSFEDYARAKGIIEDTDEIGLVTLLMHNLYPEYNEAVEDIQRFIDGMDHNLADKMKSLFLVGCLCSDYKNRLMWSHYANGHKGFCVEYDFSGTEKETLEKLPLPVLYSENRPLVPWKAKIDNSFANKEEAYAEIVIGLLTKDRIWEYENEWRILINSMTDTELQMPKISCIYLGANIEEENREKIIDIAKIKNIPVKQMKVDHGAYDLHAEDVFGENIT